ncbi:extracellular solute-binding protein [Cohnella ginsengisoli]|uniref:Extracellular solute-binding protein n=1 Tax=Cohnella ginsengisoli TaxID=425004 RepID=A0A9X4KHP2_9BACL|nr:extracellular solute-binding protein [Cohnella ginsengisoli]MDG0790292.1 extracellular solute-binding protein [Cohnella ginsengisoli]
MKRQVARRLLSVCLALILVLVAACSNRNEDTAESAKASEQSTNAGEGSAAPTAESGTKYDPPIQLSTIRTIPSDQYFDEGENIDHNAIYDYYKEKLGIEIKNKWTVTNDYSNKLKIAIASNDLPDFFLAGANDLQQLIDNDMIMDLTEVWDKYASADTKSEFTKDGGRQMKTATFGGKLMAIPETNSPYNRTSYVWVRRDWLKEMNLPEPKTMNDVLKISEAFAKRDTGGKGKAFGLSLSKTLNLSGFFSGYHLYPDMWVKDAAGNLQFGSLDPRMKVALQQLQDLFKAGQIDPEFGVKDDSKALELMAGDRVGLMYGWFWNSFPLATSAVKDGKVVQDWAPYPIVSVDDQPALSPTTAAVPQYYVINKNAKNPEAVIKLLNEWIDYVLHPTEENGLLVFGKAKKDTGHFFYAINPIVVFSQDSNVVSGDLIPRALQTGDVSLLGKDVDRNARYEAAKKYKEGQIDGASWSQYLVAGEGGTMAQMYEAYKKRQILLR